MVGLGPVELSCLVGLSGDCFPSKVIFVSWLDNIESVNDFSSSVLKVGFKMVWTIKSSVEFFVASLTCSSYALVFIRCS